MSPPIVSAWGFEAIPDWTFLVAFSFFRSIAIHQGVYKRSLDGNASNPEFARQVGESVPFVAHIAWEGGRSRRLSLIGRLVVALPQSASRLAGDDRPC